MGVVEEETENADFPKFGGYCFMNSFSGSGPKNRMIQEGLGMALLSARAYWEQFKDKLPAGVMTNAEMAQAIGANRQQIFMALQYGVEHGFVEETFRKWSSARNPRTGRIQSLYRLKRA